MVAMTAVTCQFGFVTNTAACFTFFSSPKIAFYKTVVFSTQTEEMPIPLQNAGDLQSLCKLTKRNCHFDQMIVNTCPFIYTEVSHSVTFTQIDKINGS